MARTTELSPGSRLQRTIVIFVATGGFVGYAPFMPGTVGSVLGLVGVRLAIGSIWRYSLTGFLALFALAVVVSCIVTDRAEQLLAEPDSSAIVLDEILGMIATMLGNPTNWKWLIIGFALFRVFDIIKPWPASRFNRTSGGTAIMLDDLAAAVYANVILQLLWRIT